MMFAYVYELYAQIIPIMIGRSPITSTESTRIPRTLFASQTATNKGCFVLRDCSILSKIV